MNSLCPLLDSVYVKINLPIKHKLKLNQTIQCYNGSNIGFTFGNSMELSSMNILNVRIIEILINFTNLMFLFIFQLLLTGAINFLLLVELLKRNGIAYSYFSL